MKDDVAEVVVDEDGNIIEDAGIERVKPVLEILDEEPTLDDEDEDETEEDLEEDIEEDTDEDEE
jgi:DNA gyrase subunit A